MTLKIFLTSILALLLLTPMAGAANMKSGQLTGAFGAGLAIPNGDFGDAAKTGFGGLLNLDYAVSPAVTLGGTFQYNRHGLSDDLQAALDLLAFPLTVDGHFTVMHYGVDMKFYFTPERSTRPYFTAGGGIYNYKATLESGGISASDSDSDAGINGGVGILFDAGSKTHIGLQGVYHSIFTEDSSTDYISVQALFSFDLNTP